MYIRCTGVLSQIKDEASEELIVEEKGQNKKFEQTTNSKNTKPPKIHSQNFNYQIGDHLQLNCSTPFGLPAAYLEWLVNNKRINEQYVYNYATNLVLDNDHFSNQHLNELKDTELTPNYDNLKSIELFRPKNNRLRSSGHLANRTNLNEPERNSVYLLTKTSNKSHLNRLNYKKMIRKPDIKLEEHQNDNSKDFQNDYLFSNNLKKLNLLSFHQRNKSNLNVSLNNHLGQVLQFDNLTFPDLPNSLFANNFNQPSLYNNNVNLTRLQNIIYQHYADYSFKNASHKIGIKFRIMKKHYQVKLWRIF